jgi:DNA-binding MarR family transcriptional regulator
VGDVDALDLIVLGRQLTKIGEEAMRGSKAESLPTGPTLVLRDVLAHPDSSITEVTARTGLPQSYASESVARLRELGVVETVSDPSDGRRTLVRVSGRHLRNVARMGAVSVDVALAVAVGETDPGAIGTLLVSLDALAERLRPAEPGPFRQQMQMEEQCTAES